MIEKFEQFMKFEGRSPYTIRQYKFAVKRFLEWIGSREIDEDTLFDYITHLREMNYCSRSISSTMAAVKKYTKINDIPVNWSKIPTPKIFLTFNPVVLTKEQISEIMNNAKKKKHCLMFKLSYEACLRAGELCNVKVKNLDLDNNLIRVRALKGGRTCEVPLSDELIKRIRYYIKRNRKKLKDYLFSTRSGTKINPNYLSSRIFKKLVKNLGIECRFHDFSRHSRITHLIKDGVPLEAVHKISRHRKLGVTLEYITLSGKDLRKLIFYSHNSSV